MVLRPQDFIQGRDSGEDYEVIREIGRGGFGIAYLVVRISDNAEFIAKEPKDLEKKLIKALNSEFVVLSNLEQKNVPYVARAEEIAEYTNSMGHLVDVLLQHKAPGIGLDEIMKNGPVSEKDCLDIVSKVAEAIAKVHEAGYIHRDLSPDNILVDDFGGRNDVTIIDFGIAALKSEMDTHVMVSVIAGKSFFSPPEQLDSGRGAQISIGNDIFSLGATAVALLIGEPKFSQYRSNRPSVPYDIFNHNNSIDQHFRDVIMKSTWKDRAGRFATMADMAKALGGGIPDESLPRIVTDGKSYVLTGGGPWMIGRLSELDQRADIPVAETSTVRNYIHREHVNVRKIGDNIFQMNQELKAFNDVWVKKKNSWENIKEKGYRLGKRHIEIALGYTINPPDETDIDGNKLQPGPYKTIEFFPPKGDGTTILGGLI